MTYIVKPKGRDFQVVEVFGDRFEIPIALFYGSSWENDNPAAKSSAERYAQQCNDLDQKIGRAVKGDHQDGTQ